VTVSSADGTSASQLLRTSLRRLIRADAIHRVSVLTGTLRKVGQGQGQGEGGGGVDGTTAASAFPSSSASASAQAPSLPLLIDPLHSAASSAGRVTRRASGVAGSPTAASASSSNAAAVASGSGAGAGATAPDASAGPLPSSRAASPSLWQGPTGQLLQTYAASMGSMFLDAPGHDASSGMLAWHRDRTTAYSELLPRAITKATASSSATTGTGDAHGQSSRVLEATETLIRSGLVDELRARASDRVVILVDAPELFDPNVLADFVSLCAGLAAGSGASGGGDSGAFVPISLVFGVSATREVFLSRLPAGVASLLSLSSVFLANSTHVIRSLFDLLLIHGALPLTLPPKADEAVRQAAAYYHNSMARIVDMVTSAISLHHGRIPPDLLRSGSRIAEDLSTLALAGGGTLQRRTFLGYRATSKGINKNASPQKKRTVSPPRLDPLDVPSFPASPWFMPDTSNSSGSGAGAGSGSGGGADQRLNIARVSILCLPYERWAGGFAKRDAGGVPPATWAQSLTVSPLPPSEQPASSGMSDGAGASTSMSSPSSEAGGLGTAATDTMPIPGQSYVSSPLWALCTRVAAWLPVTEVQYVSNAVPSYRQAHAEGTLTRVIDREPRESVLSGLGVGEGSQVTTPVRSHRTGRGGIGSRGSDVAMDVTGSGAGAGAGAGAASGAASGAGSAGAADAMEVDGGGSAVTTPASNSSALRNAMDVDDAEGDAATEPRQQQEQEDDEDDEDADTVVGDDGAGSGGEGASLLLPPATPVKATTPQAEPTPAKVKRTRIRSPRARMKELKRLSDFLRANVQVVDEGDTSVTGIPIRDAPIARNPDRSFTPIAPVQALKRTEPDRHAIAACLYALTRHRIGWAAAATCIVSVAYGRLPVVPGPLAAPSVTLRAVYDADSAERAELLSKAKAAVSAMTLAKLRDCIRTLALTLAYGVRQALAEAGTTTDDADKTTSTIVAASMNAAPSSGIKPAETAAGTGGGKRGSASAVEATRGKGAGARGHKSNDMEDVDADSAGGKGAGSDNNDDDDDDDAGFMRRPSKRARGKGRRVRARARNNGGIIESKEGESEEDEDAMDEDDDEEEEEDKQMPGGAASRSSGTGRGRLGGIGDESPLSPTASPARQGQGPPQAVQVTGRPLSEWAWAITPAALYRRHLVAARQLLYDIDHPAERLVPPAPSPGAGEGAGAGAGAGAGGSARDTLVSKVGFKMSAQARRQAALRAPAAAAAAAASAALGIDPIALTTARDRAASWLRDLASDFLRPITDLPLHEAVTFNALTPLKRAFVASPRTSIYTVLSRPWEIAGAPPPAGLAAVPAGDGTGPQLSPLLPDIVIAFRIYEATRGRLLHVGAWWTEFREVFWKELDAEAQALGRKAQGAKRRAKRGGAGAGAGSKDEMEVDDDDEFDFYGGGGIDLGADGPGSPSRIVRLVSDAGADGGDGAEGEDHERLDKLMENGNGPADGKGAGAGAGAGQGAGARPGKRARKGTALAKLPLATEEDEDGANGGGAGAGAGDGSGSGSGSGDAVESLTPLERSLLLRFWWAVGALRHHGIIRPYRRGVQRGVYVEKLFFNVTEW
jgi:hypothetical protein